MRQGVSSKKNLCVVKGLLLPLLFFFCLKSEERKKKSQTPQGKLATFQDPR